MAERCSLPAPRSRREEPNFEFVQRSWAGIQKGKGKWKIQREREGETFHFHSHRWEEEGKRKVGTFRERLREKGKKRKLAGKNLPRLPPIREGGSFFTPPERKREEGGRDLSAR